MRRSLAFVVAGGKRRRKAGWHPSKRSPVWHGRRPRHTVEVSTHLRERRLFQVGQHGRTGPGPIALLAFDGRARPVAEYHYNLRGDVDVATASDIRADLQAIIEGSDSHVLIDCTQLTFIDSSGLRVLVALAKDAESRGTALGLRNLPRHAQRVLELTGLGDWFEVT